MKAVVDSEGRIAIPEQIRDETGLTPGTEVEVRCRDGYVELEPIEEAYRIEERGHFLVGVRVRPGPALTRESTEQTLEEIRLERERAALGPHDSDQ